MSRRRGIGRGLRMACAAPSGIMVGTYQMENETGERFDIAVPPFSLDSPHQPIQLN